jgi:hypothetical protein
LQAGTFEISYGGAEASVAISLANYGIPPAFLDRHDSIRGDAAASNPEEMSGFFKKRGGWDSNPPPIVPVLGSADTG